MSDTKQRFPLNWPASWPRARSRGSHKFAKVGRELTLDRARRFVLEELRRLGASEVVISSNVELRLDGYPRSGQRQPEDPGVAVYFRRKGESKCIPVDTYRTPEANLYAIGLCIEAMRGLERWGAPRLVDAAFSGFRALPELAGPSAAAWWDVLGVPPSADRAAVLAAYREKSRRWHPDAEGGNSERFVQVQAALAASGFEK